jgi:hypothetical protein
MAALKVYRESGAALGRKIGPLSAETRAKIAQTLKGHKNGPMSEEIKAKIGAANRGKKRVRAVLLVLEAITDVRWQLSTIPSTVIE